MIALDEHADIDGEQVEHGLMAEDDFKDFVFTNPLTFQTRVNPDFFTGTAVEGAVASVRAAAE